jgi:hypothetical protein
MNHTDICNFTLPHYRWILEKALDLGFNIFRLKDLNQLTRGKRRLFLRHDIDFSVRHASRMAALEKSMGVFSSYFVFLHSPTYSIGDLETFELLREIQNMGHEIALHYDAECYEKAGIEFLDGIEMESEFLGRLFGQRICSASQHRPGTQGYRPVTKVGLVNAYDKSLMQDVAYISDSRRLWRAGCVHEHLEKTMQMQLLIHPEWWEDEIETTRRESIEGIVKERNDWITDRTDEYLLSMEKKQVADASVPRVMPG